LIQLIGNETKQITTSGSSKGDSVTYTIDNANNRINIKGTGKVDVHLDASGVFPDFNISAKSYSSDSRDISLFTGKLLPLMAVWPTSPHNKKYYYNALLRQNPTDFLMHTRLILAIQALAGTSKNALADTLVLYNRSNKEHPIRVYSI
jgi:hypothetical protein